MTEAWRRRSVLAGLLVVGGVVFFTGIDWGLPSREADGFLFGRRPAWTGREIMQLAGERDEGPGRGANVPTHLLDRSGILWINQTDAQRAEIVRRYRLYTEQPDEMTVLMALRGMGPGKGYDPRFYQYGGLFLYPVGGIIRAAGAVGLIHLTPSIEYYLDHPEEFGRFYVAARCYVALWGVLGVWIVFGIARRAGLKLIASAVATLIYIAMPVVINMTHEAKPHLPGALLALLACAAAARYVESGRRRWMLAAGGLCGACVGMVLSGAWSFGFLPVMVLLRGQTSRARMRHLCAATAIGVAVYCATNPYVPVNILRNREVLRSNIGNSTDMYHVAWGAGGRNALGLIAEGASLPVACVGAAAVVLGLRRRLPKVAPVPGGDGGWNEKGRDSLIDPSPQPAPLNTRERGLEADQVALSRGRVLGLLLAVPVALTLVQFFALAGGKPGEYGRFAVLPDIVLGIAAVGAAVRWCGRWLAGVTLAVLLLGACAGGGAYLAGFVRDCGRRTTRSAAADLIWQVQEGGARSVALWVEPAPFSSPPVDLFTTRLLLLPPDYVADKLHAPADILVRAVDVERGPAPVDPVYYWWSPPRWRVSPTRISWADKPFDVGVRKD